MANHRIGTRAEWLDARLKLLRAEKELTRLNDELARRRRELPWVRLDRAYGFDTEGGQASLVDLFRGRSQLIIYHLMFDPDWDEACPSCSAIADGFDKTHLHLQNHDVAFTAGVAWRRSTSSSGIGTEWTGASPGPRRDEATSTTTSTSRSTRTSRAGGIQLPEPSRARGGWSGEMPGMSAFVLEDGVVYHTYSAYSRGFDALWTMWQWLDLAPLGRNEGDLSWFRRHDQYEKSYR